MASGLEIDLRRLRRERPPVLLLGGLNILRPLGWAGIPVIVASFEPDAPALASRFCSGRCLLPPIENREAVVDALLRAGERLTREFGQPLPIFYGNDDTLGLVQDYREALAPYFRLALNDAEIGRALIDKARFQALACKRGLPVPRALSWDELSGCRSAVLVKPKVKMAWDGSPIHQRLFEAAGKARIYPTGRDVVASPLATQLRNDLLFQEYLPGDDRNLRSFHGFATETGKVLAWCCGRKLRTHPALTGESSYLELLHDSELARFGLEVAARLTLKGMFKIDFKKDPRTGRYYILEVNARYNLWHHAAARNGLNLPRIAYEYLVYGKRPAARRYGTRFRWLCLRLDYRAFRDLASRGEINALQWLCSLAAAPKVYDLFSWSDPVPFLKHLYRRLKSLPRFTGRLLRWLSTAY